MSKVPKGWRRINTHQPVIAYDKHKRLYIQNTGHDLDFIIKQVKGKEYFTDPTDVVEGYVRVRRMPNHLLVNKFIDSVDVAALTFMWKGLALNNMEALVMYPSKDFKHKLCESVDFQIKNTAHDHTLWLSVYNLLASMPETETDACFVELKKRTWPVLLHLLKERVRQFFYGNTYTRGVFHHAFSNIDLQYKNGHRFEVDMNHCESYHNHHAYNQHQHFLLKTLNKTHITRTNCQSLFPEQSMHTLKPTEIHSTLKLKCRQTTPSTIFISHLW